MLGKLRTRLGITCRHPRQGTHMHTHTHALLALSVPGGRRQSVHHPTTPQAHHSWPHTATAMPHSMHCFTLPHHTEAVPCPHTHSNSEATAGARPNTLTVSAPLRRQRNLVFSRTHHRHPPFTLDTLMLLFVVMRIKNNATKNQINK